MNIKITIEVTGDGDSVTIDNANEDETPLPSVPTGCEAMIEHANHDSTPRMLGFTANPPTYSDDD